jgi:hypothetical protein
VGGCYGRRSRWVGVHSDEVYFRDTAHGFVAWALASVLGAVLLASPAGSLISGSGSGATQGAAAAAARSGPMDGYVDTLLRSDTPANEPDGDSKKGWRSIGEVSEFLPKDGAARAVQIDICPGRIGARRIRGIPGATGIVSSVVEAGGIGRPGYAVDCRCACSRRTSVGRSACSCARSAASGRPAG